MSGVLLAALAVLGGLGFYLARRLHQALTLFFPRLPFRPVVALLLVLTAVLAGGFLRSMLPVPQGVRDALGVISAYWMGLWVYLVLFTLGADALRLVLRAVLNTDPARLRGVCALAAAAAALITAGAGFFHAQRINHVTYDIHVGMEQPMTVLLISDLHLGAVGSEGRLEAVVEQINSREPELICIAGDIFDSDFGAIRDPEAAAATLSSLRAKYGVYACLGNHDAGTTADKMVDFLRRCGIQLLSEEAVEIDHRLILIGRSDARPIGTSGTTPRGQLQDFFRREETALPVIVLDHNPAYYDEYGPQADLILSGHTHRGQIFPGSLITGVLYAADYGHYQPTPADPHLVVTSGVGWWGMPMRLGTDCEIVTIHLE